ncbi:MAG: hypothetical protein RRA92_08280 [Gemmatimonadota bacterium]|nr:hypothetical protein [Gemmatimonadota bacterium]
MNVQVTRRNAVDTDEVEARALSLVEELPGAVERVALAKFALERREPSTCAVAVVLAFADGEESLVRQASAPDWERALLELERKLARAWEEHASEAPPAG